MQGQLWNAGTVNLSPGRRRQHVSKAGTCRAPRCTKQARPVQGALRARQQALREWDPPEEIVTSEEVPA